MALRQVNLYRLVRAVLGAATARIRWRHEHHELQSRGKASIGHRVSQVTPLDVVVDLAFTGLEVSQKDTRDPCFLLLFTQRRSIIEPSRSELSPPTVSTHH